MLVLATFLHPCANEPSHVSLFSPPRDGVQLGVGDNTHCLADVSYSHEGGAGSSPSDSITDQFIEFLRQRSMALQAAEQLAAQDAEEIHGEDDDQDVQMDLGGISILENRPGTRNLFIFRPDPQDTGRPESMRFQATPATTLDEIQRAIYRIWADLAQGQLPWRLLEAHPSVHNSLYVEDDQEIFLIMAFQDYELGQAPVLMEYQTWNLNEKRFEGILRAEVRNTQFAGKDIMHVPTHGHVCFFRLCPVLINGYAVQADDQYDIRAANYFVQIALASMDGLVGVIGHWTMFMNQEAVITEAFSRISGVALAAGTTLSLEKCRHNAIKPANCSAKCLPSSLPPVPRACLDTWSHFLHSTSRRH